MLRRFRYVQIFLKQGSKSRQNVMRLYKQWHRPISKRFIKPPYSISRATSIDSECCRIYPRPQRSQCGRCYTFGCMVAIRGGYRMARGWHYTKLSLSSTLLLSSSGMCILLLFFSFLVVVFVVVFFFLFSRWSCV